MNADAAARSISELMARGDLAAAYDACAKALRTTPDHAELTFLAATLATRAGRATQAQALAARAAALAPQSALYAAYHAKCALALDDFATARREAERASALAPKDAPSWDVLGFVLMRVGRQTQAVDAFAQAAALAPEQAGYWLNLGAARVTTGDLAGAETAYANAAALAPEDPAPYASLVQLRKQTPDRNWIEAITRLRARTRDAGDILALSHALAKSQEDLGDYPAAMQSLAEGKQQARAAVGYDFAREAPLFDSAKRAYAPGGGYADAQPIFIVGLPRTGTTLIERIVSSHPEIVTAGELLEFPIQTRRQAAPDARALFSAEMFDAACAIDHAVLGRAYSERVAARMNMAKRAVDKLPANFLYAGLILSALPNARVICLRRDPMDSVLGNYRQLFGADQPFYHHAYDLEDCARYYVLFDQLIAHWRAALPSDRFTEIHYEALLDDQEAETRRLIAFCGLPWDPACLAFEANAQPVATASAAQVREPLHRRLEGRWRRYGPLLDPARAILEAAELGNWGP